MASAAENWPDSAADMRPSTARGSKTSDTPVCRATARSESPSGWAGWWMAWRAGGPASAQAAPPHHNQPARPSTDPINRHRGGTPAGPPRLPAPCPPNNLLCMVCNSVAKL
jgi:hypothetical protein